MKTRTDLVKLAGTVLAAVLICSSSGALGTELPLRLNGTCVGTGTPGYWMNHPEAWPVESITIGLVTYDKDEAIALMKAPTAGDKTLTLFQAYVAAVLNVLNGAEALCPVWIDGAETTILALIFGPAECWLVEYPPGSGVAASSPAWQEPGGCICSGKPIPPGEAIYLALDAWNNGELCAPSRDELEELELMLSGAVGPASTPGGPSDVTDKKNKALTLSAAQTRTLWRVLSGTCVGTGTPGYWMNHPEAWPVTSITIGEVTYPQAVAIALMKAPTAGDKTLTLFQAYVAAVLNVLNGAEALCPVWIDGEKTTILALIFGPAECWLVEYPPGSGVAASSPAWQEPGGCICSGKPIPPGEAIYLALDAWNNGELCAPSRDELEDDD